MSTKERALTILNRFSEEELERFVAYFGIIYPVSDDTGEVSQKHSEIKLTSCPSDEIEERRAAFARMEALCRPIPDLDEKKELAEYREEKYGR